MTFSLIVQQALRSTVATHSILVKKRIVPMSFRAVGCAIVADATGPRIN
jgi:hypothetical protein